VLWWGLHPALRSLLFGGEWPCWTLQLQLQLAVTVTVLQLVSLLHRSISIEIKHVYKKKTSQTQTKIKIQNAITKHKTLLVLENTPCVVCYYIIYCARSFFLHVNYVDLHAVIFCKYSSNPTPTLINI
jgi:hypothetical protein